MPHNSMNALDQKIIKHAAGFSSVAFNKLQRALKRIPKRDRITRDLIETALMMIEDGQQLLVMVAVPVGEQQTQIMDFAQNRRRA